MDTFSQHRLWHVTFVLKVPSTTGLERTRLDDHVRIQQNSAPPPKKVWDCEIFSGDSTAILPRYVCSTFHSAKLQAFFRLGSIFLTPFTKACRFF